MPLLVLCPACLVECGEGISGQSIYGSIPPADYLRGMFTPSKNPDFVNLSEYDIPTDNKKHLLRREAAVALQRLYADFHKAHPAIPFRVRSSTRNFEDQKEIWESKWQALDRHDPAGKVRSILRYSSMPGTSRHHWGTEVDLNELDPHYFRTGPGKTLYDWLAANAAGYGFCQPYTPGRKEGYCEEPWHWSYAPLSKAYREAWNRYADEDEAFLGKLAFQGAAKAIPLARTYVNAVNGACR